MTTSARAWEETLGIRFEREPELGPVERATLPLADCALDEFLAMMLRNATEELQDVRIAAFVGTHDRAVVTVDGSMPALPPGIDWCSERVGKLTDLDSPVISDEEWTYVITSCDAGWLIGAGPSFQARRFVAFARIAGALWASARDRAATQKEAVTDFLTNLLNRAGLHKRLAEIPSRQRMCVLSGDLDGLKEANDSKGHSAGDTLICTASAVMTSVMRGDDIVARVGGDEFVIVSLGQQADVVLARLRAALARQAINVSWGAVSIPDEVATVAEAMQLADERMYADKALRKGKKR